MNYFRLMQEGMGKFQGTPEEIRFTVATADLALQRGETDTALNILRTIGSEQPYFIQAKEKMAQIFLHHRKDKKMYAQCFRQIVETSPTPQSYILLGDAYMAIQVKFICSEISQNFATFSEYMNFKRRASRSRIIFKLVSYVNGIEGGVNKLLNGANLCEYRTLSLSKLGSGDNIFFCFFNATNN